MIVYMYDFLFDGNHVFAMFFETLELEKCAVVEMTLKDTQGYQ